ncbi:MAG: M23 family metallopeptidase [Deltaproteobacteria bacterium]|nr:MAG: M23 family metallopeptidase [Deltaproteobacteria bacterium]
MDRVWKWLAVLLAACQPAIEPAYAPRAATERTEPDDPRAAVLEDRMIDFRFDGGQLEFELHRTGSRVQQVVRNRYAVAVTMHWTIAALDNLEPLSPVEGTAVLPAARAPLGAGEPVVIAELARLDPTAPYRRELYFHARFGDPRARARPYVYALPYPHGLTFAVLQGFHGEFSHRGSNEYAVDFDCPVATPVIAARPGVVVAVNASAQGSGTSPEYLDDRRANFVIILHGDGTLGEYMHLAPSGVEVAPGQTVRRGQELGLSGNTGFSSTPHLHFQVMTAADDGMTKRSFPFELAVAPQRASAPIEGRRYAAWE